MRKALSALLAVLSVVNLMTAAVFSKEYTYESPVEPELWMDPDFSADHAYSLAFVGDTQNLCQGDYYLGTNTMEQLYGRLADTAKERKLEHVFVLGDITDMGYRNDANLAHTHYDPPLTGEWEIAQDAILQMSDAGISYSLCRGNHDDYMIDDYFNIPAYTDQFKDVGGFFSDSDAKHPTLREKKNPEGYIYWSALTGYHENSIVNSYKTARIGENKYIFITVDFNPTLEVVQWVDRILGEYADHLAIVATHSYLGSNGTLRTSDKGDTMYPLGYTADKLWDLALKNHKNLLMVACGHVGVTTPVYSAKVGTHGNTVHQFLIDPQRYDVKNNSDGSVVSGTQDTGMVLYMNFSADGSKVTFDYYSTLLNKEMKSMSEKEIILYENSPTRLIPGDADYSGKVDLDDAIYLLYHVNFSDTYKVFQNFDLDGNGVVDLDDAVYLLYHVNFPENYPLNIKKEFV